MRKYILGIILTLFLGLFGIFNADTMALDSDYKNNLLKVDVTKANDGSYKIDLFTQKPYNEPIKVIKKSDTSYYVFLPETYHSITSVGTSGDINKVDVKLFPYAGQDLNNGYTKIDISTSKPVTFTTSVRTASKQAPRVDAKKLAQLDSAFDGKPNYPTAQKVEVKPVVQPSKVQPVAKPVVQPVEVKEPAKVAVKPTPVVAPQQKTVAEKVDKAIDKAKQDAQKIASNAGTEIEIVTKSKTQMQEPKGGTLDVEKKASPVDLEEVLDGELSDEDILSLEEDAKEQGLTELATGEEEVIPEMTRNQRIKQMIKLIAKTALDNILALIAIALLLVVLVLLLSPKRKAAREVAESPVYESLGNIVDSVVTKAEAAKAEEAERAAYEQGNAETPAAFENAGVDTYEPKPMQTYQEESPVAVEEEPADEADVLATESFGENRGLCLVNYDGSIALIGYIEDEIFVIQNFGKITLLNPSIQVRVAEQNDHDTIYIVKTANSKLMVRETKTIIGLEMVM